MSEINTGGLAFPYPDWGEEGMTLRDYFAAKAMQGDWACADSVVITNGKDEAARVYYAMADEMLKARVMTRDDITRMAKEAGISYSGTLPEIFDSQDQLERFAALVAAHERDECAKLCDDIAKDNDSWKVSSYDWKSDGCRDCADAIRARSKQ